MIKFLIGLNERRLIRYIVVGGVVMGLYLLTLFVLIEYAGTPTPVAILIAYLSTAIVRFLLHRSWVFSADYNMMHSHFIKYLVMMACSYFLNVATTELLAHRFLWEAGYVAISSAIIATAFAYVTSLKWVFK